MYSRNSLWSYVRCVFMSLMKKVSRHSHYLTPPNSLVFWQGCQALILFLPSLQQYVSWTMKTTSVWSKCQLMIVINNPSLCPSWVNQPCCFFHKCYASISSSLFSPVSHTANAFEYLCPLCLSLTLFIKLDELRPGIVWAWGTVKPN